MLFKGIFGKRRKTGNVGGYGPLKGAISEAVGTHQTFGTASGVDKHSDGEREMESVNYHLD